MAHFETRARRHIAPWPATGIARWLRQVLATWQQRQALRALPPERLRDIGITEREAHLEASKPIWNVPAHWIR